ncbi:MAG: hypothetical protein ACI9UA_002255 [Pseudoalteromonas tetraodonis]|jgi:hypothetical protein
MNFSRNSAVLIAFALCVIAMTTHVLAEPKINGKTEDTKKTSTSSVVDAIKTTDSSDDDENNGHGNDASGIDPSNPGASTMSSVLVLLGVTNPTSPTMDCSLYITPPTTTTDDPFSDTMDEGGGSLQTVDSITVLPFGSVPLIRDDAGSVDFLLQKILSDVEAAALQNNEITQLTPKMETAHKKYAKKLASTLSGLSVEQQNYVFYGRKK